MNAGREDDTVRSMQPELWVDRDGAALKFYRVAFDATVLHLVGEGE